MTANNNNADNNNRGTVNNTSPTHPPPRGFNRNKPQIHGYSPEDATRALTICHEMRRLEAAGVGRVEAAQELTRRVLPPVAVTGGGFRSERLGGGSASVTAAGSGGAAAGGGGGRPMVRGGSGGQLCTSSFGFAYPFVALCTLLLHFFFFGVAVSRACVSLFRTDPLMAPAIQRPRSRHVSSFCDSAISIPRSLWFGKPSRFMCVGVCACCRLDGGGEVEAHPVLRVVAVHSLLPCVGHRSFKASLFLDSRHARMHAPSL